MNNKEWHSYRRDTGMYTILCCALSSVGHEEGVPEFGDRLCHSSSDTWLFGGTLLHKSALLLCASIFHYWWLRTHPSGTVTCFGVHLSYIIDGQDVCTICHG